MLEIVETFDGICEGYEVVILDTSVCSIGKKTDKKKKELMERMGRGIIKKYCYHNPKENLEYINEMTESVAKYPQVQTVEGVIDEINQGVNSLGNMLGPKKRRKRENIKTYMASIKGMRNNLKTRVIRFSGKEKLNLEILKREMDYFKEMHDLGYIDFKILANSVNAATYMGDTALLSNDIPLLNAALEITDDPEKTLQPICAMPMKYKLDTYTSLFRKSFYKYSRDVDFFQNNF